MGRSKSESGGQTFGRGKVSRVHRGYEHRGDLAFALRAERFRSGSGSKARFRGNEDRRHAQPDNRRGCAREKGLRESRRSHGRVAPILAGGKGGGRASHARVDRAPVRFLQSLRFFLRALHSAEHLMNTAAVQAKQPVSMPAAAESASSDVATSRGEPCLRARLSLPLATLMALAVHIAVSK